MRLLSAVCLTVNLLALIAMIGAQISPVVAPAKMTLCNLIQDSHCSEVIKRLETKLENFIALVNKSLTPQPTPLGKLAQFFVILIFFRALAFYTYTTF